MIKRRLKITLMQRPGEVPAAVLSGPGQVGKTTLAIV